MTASSMAPLAPHLKTKALRGLMVYEKERLKEFPDIPTTSKLGFPVVHSSGYGIVAPRKTPDEIVKRLYDTSKKVLDENRKYIEERVAELALILDFQGPEEFAATLKKENEDVKKVVKELKATEKK